MEKDTNWGAILTFAALGAVVIYAWQRSRPVAALVPGPTPAPNALPPTAHAPAPNPFRPPSALSPSRVTPGPQGPLTIQNTETLTAPFAQNFVPDTTETVSRF